MNVLIMGGSGGLGKELSYMFAKNDHQVFIHGRNQNLLNHIKIKLIDKCQIIDGDIKDNNFIDRLEKYISDNNINCFINSVGMYSLEDFIDTDDKDIEEMVLVNFLKPILLQKRIYSIYLNLNFGTIVNINSFAGKKANFGNEIVYSATKFGMRGFTESLKLDVIKNKSKINIIDIYIGAMKTSMLENRIDYDLFIDPKDAAKVIYNSVVEDNSLRINNIEIRRSKYK